MYNEILNIWEKQGRRRHPQMGELKNEPNSRNNVMLKGDPIDSSNAMCKDDLVSHNNAQYKNDLTGGIANSNTMMGGSDARNVNDIGCRNGIEHRKNAVNRSDVGDDANRGDAINRSDAGDIANRNDMMMSGISTRKHESEDGFAKDGISVEISGRQSVGMSEMMKKEGIFIGKNAMHETQIENEKKGAINAAKRAPDNFSFSPYDNFF